MKRWMGCCVSGLSVIAATMATGQDATAPLNSTQQELRKLESDKKVKTGTTPAVMPSLDLPTMQTVVESAPSPYHLAKARELEQERKSRGESRNNWLVNGVEKLSQGESTKNPNSAEGLWGESAGQQSEGEQEYLLNAFNAQRKATDAKQMEATKARATQPDPFAPFLKDWLGTSPSLGKFADSFGGRTNEQSSLVNSTGGFTGGPSGNSGLNRSAVEHALESADAKPNPYLAAASSNDSRGPTSIPGLFQPNLNPITLSKPAAEQSFTPRLEKIEEPPSSAQRQQFTIPADEKKYFPQLKKF